MLMLRGLLAQHCLRLHRLGGSLVYIPAQPYMAITVYRLGDGEPSGRCPSVLRTVTQISDVVKFTPSIRGPV